MKKFIKAVVVASVLVSANSAFASLSKAGSSGTGGVACPHKMNVGRFAATADQQTAKAVVTPVNTVNGKIVR